MKSLKDIKKGNRLETSRTLDEVNCASHRYGRSNVALDPAGISIF